MPFATTWMDLEMIISEVSQTEKSKELLIYGIWKEKKKADRKQSYDYQSG